MSGEMRSPFVPMSIAFIGIGAALLVSIVWVEGRLEVVVNLGSAFFLLLMGSLCAFLAYKKGEFKFLVDAINRMKKT
ncbi:MAG TPA: hypothetical protein HA346_01400 [Thermoplasmata archaeon]|nr:hypothetical protein [Thermoplasmata archaeon]